MRDNGDAGVESDRCRRGPAVIGWCHCHEGQAKTAAAELGYPWWLGPQQTGQRRCLVPAFANVPPSPPPPPPRWIALGESRGIRWCPCFCLVGHCQRVVQDNRPAPPADPSSLRSLFSFCFVFWGGGSVVSLGVGHRSSLDSSPRPAASSTPSRQRAAGPPPAATPQGPSSPARSRCSLSIWP